MSTKPRILIVDDDEFILNSLELILLQRGYEVFVADSASRALDLLETMSPFSLILLDYQLPDMKAELLISRLPEVNAQDIPVILITGHNDPRGKAKALHCASSLPKPFSLNELFAVLDTYTARP